MLISQLFELMMYLLGNKKIFLLAAMHLYVKNRWNGHDSWW